MLGDINNVNYYRDIPCDKNLYNIYYLMTCYFNDKNSIEIHKEHQKRIVVAIIMKWILEDKIDFQNDSLV